MDALKGTKTELACTLWMLTRLGLEDGASGKARDVKWPTSLVGLRWYLFSCLAIIKTTTDKGTQSTGREGEIARGQHEAYSLI